MQFLILLFKFIVIIFKFLNSLLLFFLRLFNQLHVVLELFRELFLLFNFIQKFIAFLNLICSQFLDLLPFEHGIRDRLRNHTLHFYTLRVQETPPLRIKFLNHFLRLLERFLQSALLLFVFLLIALKHILHFLGFLLFLLDSLHICL